MIIYPAIDLKDGQCVRLVQGKKEDKTVYSDTPGQSGRLLFRTREPNICMWWIWMGLLRVVPAI